MEARIKQNRNKQRFEGYVHGKLKAYTKDDTAGSKKQIAQAFEDKGYRIIFE